jgi:uncharacterized membrane protein (UPF0127 family)
MSFSKIKFKYLFLVSLFLIAVVFLIGFNFLFSKPRVIIGSINILVEVAKTEAAKTKGLSGRLALDKDKGMLFVFSKPDFYRFWMPEMRFPIDIIWINDQKVVGITPDVSHNFDPLKPDIYSPARPAQYVLEVNASFSAEKNIQVGDAVVFKNI